VQFVLNYEEGGENSVLHGDAGSEQFLSEMFQPAAYPARHLSMEGIYEYGSRVGVWRILREFERRGLPLTVFGVGMALQRCPEVTAPSSSWATRSPATAGAGSTTRTSTRPPSASTCCRGMGRAGHHG
jgi:peptidoglycan/xylan/chitin deacetylase (PgdA/CDA1 family)